MITDRTQLAVKEESVEGTAETPAGADALLVSGFKFSAPPDVTERNNTSASMSPFSAVVAPRGATMEFDVELKGSGTAGTAPALGLLLQACGYGETVVASTSVTYAPASSSIISLTLSAYQDGRLKKMWGARGEPTLKAEAGKPLMLHFAFQGAAYSVADAALLSSGVSYESTEPQPFVSAQLTIDSYAALISMLEIRAGNRLVLRPDANQASGYKSCVITRRRPAITFDPEAVLVATYDWYAKMAAGNEGALSMVIGATAGNICTITAPKVQYTGVSESERDGWETLGVDAKLNRSSGDDELVLAFT